MTRFYKQRAYPLPCILEVDDLSLNLHETNTLALKAISNYQLSLQDSSKIVAVFQFLSKPKIFNEIFTTGKYEARNILPSEN